MNVKGIGIDVVNVRRIETLLKNHPERFKDKVFTAEEYRYAKEKSNGDRQQLASILAARWAAKEAVVKAMGTGFGDGLYWQHVEIISEGGPPQVRLQNTPKQFEGTRFLLSMSHDYPTATAMAMVTA